jgi:hypothetical protein
LTGTIYGSTLSIPEHFLQILLKGTMTDKRRGEIAS